jgi:hypothetical protein
MSDAGIDMGRLTDRLLLELERAENKALLPVL